MFHQYGNNCLISNAPLQNDKSFIKKKKRYAPQLEEKIIVEVRRKRKSYY